MATTSTSHEDQQLKLNLQPPHAGKKFGRMNTASMSTSELAKNWPSSVFGRLNNESTNVENTLLLQGVFSDLAQPGSSGKPSDYESPALTAELWARRSTGILNTLRLPCPLARRSRRRTIAASALFVHTA